MERDWAPPSFCRIWHEAWEFFASIVLNEAELDFLLLCDDGKWKLREWSKQNYSSWAGNVGLREKNVGAKKGNATADEKVAVDALDHPDLIRMKTDKELESNDEPEPVIGSNSGGEGGVEVSMASDKSSNVQVRNFSAVSLTLTDIPRYPLRSRPRSPSCQIHCEYPLYYRLVSRAFFSAPTASRQSNPSTSKTSSIPPPNTTPTDSAASAAANTTAPGQVSESFLHTHFLPYWKPMAFQNARTTAPTNDAPSDSAPVDKTATHNDGDSVTTPHRATGPPHADRATSPARSDTTADTSLDLPVRIPPHARIKLTLRARSDTMPIGETQSTNPTVPTAPSVTVQILPQAQILDSDHPGGSTTPSNGNPRLDLAKANTAAAKKRKADDKLASAALKKQKMSTALAVPTSCNSVRCAPSVSAWDATDKYNLR